jgi:hypothetical protein
MLYPTELRDHKVLAVPRNFLPIPPIRGRSAKGKLTLTEPTYFGACDPLLHPNHAPCVLRCVDRDTIAVPKELNNNGKGLATATAVLDDW